MFRALLTSLVTFATLAVTAPLDAQVVRIGGIGGVRVRAPGVSVDVGPYGSTRVRAPYTAIDAYGPRYPYGPVVTYRRAVVGVPVPPVVPVPPFGPLPPFGPVPSFGMVPPFGIVPTIPVPVVPGVAYEYEEAPPITAEGYQVTRPSLDGHVSEDLRRAAVRLQSNLSVRHDADVWLEYLAPARIIESIDRGDAPGSLRDLISNYDGVVANSGLRAIYSQPGFNETRELLRVYVDLRPSRQPPAAAAAEETTGQEPAPSVLERPAEEAEELPTPPPAESPKAEGRVPPPPPPAPPEATPSPTEI